MLEIKGDSITVEELDLIGDYEDRGKGNFLKEVKVKTSSPGGNATLAGTGGEVNDTTIEGTLEVSGSENQVSNSSVGKDVDLTGDKNTVENTSVEGEIKDEGDDNTVVDIKYGDLTGDGEVTLQDALMILQNDADLIELDDEQRESGDVTGDGNVGLLDALEILRYDAELIERFPVEE